MALSTENLWISIRAFLHTFSSWKTFALILALINLKSLPFAWHVRIASAFYRSLSVRPRSISRKADSKIHPLFAPTSMTTHTSLLETDYNLHKSNSTYFTDLDISRTACVTNLFSPGLGLASKELETDPDPTKRKVGRVSVILGSVFTAFGREIPPYARYEVQTRLLSWDQKWVYMVTYFLKPGKGKDGKKTVYASSFSKYVSKKGRWTIPPEMIFRKTGLLPASWTVTLSDESSTGTPRDGIATVANGMVVTTALEKLGRGNLMERSCGRNATEPEDGEWTWSQIEEERLRGLKVVESFKAMDGSLAEEWNTIDV